MFAYSPCIYAVSSLTSCIIPPILNEFQGVLKLYLLWAVFDEEKLICEKQFEYFLWKIDIKRSTRTLNLKSPFWECQTPCPSIELAAQYYEDNDHNDNNNSNTQYVTIAHMPSTTHSSSQAEQHPFIHVEDNWNLPVSDSPSWHIPTSLCPSIPVKFPRSPVDYWDKHTNRQTRLP